MISKQRFYIFVFFAVLLIINTIYLYPWNLSFSLFESSWIVFGTLGAIASYYIALLSNFAPFQTFIMRVLFWAYSIMLFLSVMRRTFEYLNSGIPFFAVLNTLFYLIIVLLFVYEGYKLYHSYGRYKYTSAASNTQEEISIENIANNNKGDKNPNQNMKVEFTGG